jgi:hypothetical protein
MTPGGKGDIPSLPPLEYTIGSVERDIPTQTYNPQPPPHQTQNPRYSYSPYEDVSGASSPDSLDSHEYPTNYYRPDNRSSQHGDMMFFSRGEASIHNLPLQPPAVPSNTTSQHHILNHIAESDAIQDFVQEEKNELEDRVIKRQKNTESAQRYCQCV